MRKSFTCLIFALCLVSCFLNAQSNKKVLIIGIDGCRSDALEAANTPNLDGLIANGFFSPDALNTDVTISGAGWSAITTGVWSEKHLVTSNNFSGNNYEEYPHFFSHLETYDENIHTVSFCHWSPINDEIVQDHADFKLNLSSDALVASTAADYLMTNDPDVMFLHFDDVDIAGHGSGFTPANPTYLAVIEGVDELIGTVLEALQNRPNYTDEDWLIAVTTDHGGIGTSHGGNTLEERQVFVIVSGDNVPQELVLQDSSIVSDEVENCLGSTTELRFEGGNNIQVMPAEAFNFGADQDFTVECRVRTNIAADVAMVGNKDWDTGLNKGFVFSFKYASGPEWKVNIGDGSNRVDLDTGGEIADGEWYTLSVSFDRDGEMKMYQDGVLMDAIDMTSIGDITTGGGLFFGTDIDGGYQYNGALAEVRVWNTVLEAEDLLAWHCSSLDETHTEWNNLLGYWKMDAGEGTIINDASGNNHHGVVNGATWVQPDSTVVYDFSETPRLVDIVTTAMMHLCIPIDEAYDFDGQSLIEECIMVNSNDLNLLVNDAALVLSPIPAEDILNGTLNIKQLNNAELLIYDLKGRVLQQQRINNTSFSIDVSELTAGQYLVVIKTNDHSFSAKMIKI